MNEQLEIVEIYRGRKRRNGPPDRIVLVYTANGRTVTHEAGVSIGGQFFDVTAIDGEVVVTEAWLPERNAYPASECFQLATGRYPHEHEAVATLVQIVEPVETPVVDRRHAILRSLGKVA